jgi:hypothetical protein
MKRIFALAAMFALPATVSFAAIDTNGLISRFQGDGYTTIEVTRGINETKVEAIRNNEKVEVVYDNATGAVLETEFGAPDADDDIRPGVTVRDRNRDFVRDDDDRDDDGDDDQDDDRDDDNGSDDDGSDDNDNGSDDNDSDDNGSDDNGGDDNGSDDNGGDDNGSDDNGGDDNGGDDNGSDDNGGDDNGGDDNGGDDD